MALLAVSVLLGAGCAPASEANTPTSTTIPRTATPREAAVTTTTSIRPTTPASTITGATTTHATTTTTEPSPAPLDRSNAATTDRMEADIVALGLDVPRVGGSTAEKAAITAIAQTVEEITGVAAVVDPVPLPTGDASANVWAHPAGEGREVLLLGSHVDSVAVSPGVDDNGSGSVVLLELLRRLRRQPPQGLVVVVAFFGAEEVLPGYGSNDHHYGSRLAAAQLDVAGTLPDWMVSVDMVGVGDRLLAVTYNDSDPAAATALAEAGAAVDIGMTIVSRGDISDHEAFALAGTPSAMLWRPDNPAWHTADDATINTDLLLENLAVLEALIAQLANGPS